jgi:hypothetical protein
VAARKKEVTLREHLTRIAPLGAAKLTEKDRQKGGKRGGKARARALTPEQRSEIAKKAAAARWGKPKGKKQS